MHSVYQLTFPLKGKDLEIFAGIRTGDEVKINGIIITSRDMAHKYYVEKITQEPEIFSQLKPYLKNGAIYHCGPVISLENRTVLSAGPTTSMREEPYQTKVIELFGLKAVIGKGGMGSETQEGLQKNHCVYLNAVGGAGSYYAKSLKVIDVLKLKEFGMPEAIWILEARNFYTTVTMDFSGTNIHEQIEKKSSEQLKNLFL